MKTTIHKSIGRAGILSVMIILCIGCKPSLPEPVQVAYASLPEVIDYNFHVKPILSDRCYPCHGPDENTRKGNLRLDIEEEAFAKLANGNVAFMKGHPGRSEAVRRMISTDESYLMPPPSSKLILTPEEIAVITKWLEQGAEWKEHWSLLPIESPEPPKIEKPWTSINEIDQFIQAELEEQGLEPAPLADKERLLRRVTMDLTGLPPTLEEMDDFLQDSSPDAYEKVVDRLLLTDAHAERMAMEWLDIARYSDSHGVSFDGYRNMWPYRDWVIASFKDNLSYNQFIIDQVAGDLKPDASEKDKLATAFYRNNPMEASAGSINEEYRVEFVAERTALTGTAFLGLTMGCARCHDHKFDPIKQKEFFQLSAFFNSVDELGLSVTDANRAPTLLMFNPAEKARIAILENEINSMENELVKIQNEIPVVKDYITSLASIEVEGGVLFPFEEIKKIEREIKRKKPKPFEPDPEAEKMMALAKKKMAEEKKKNGKKEEKKPTEEIQILDKNTSSEATLGVTLVEGIKGKALHFDEDYDYALLKNIGWFEIHEPFSISSWIKPGNEPKGELQTIIGNSGDFGSDFRGWEVYLDKGMHLNVRIIHRIPDDYLEVSTKAVITKGEWSQVGFTYDGSGKASGVTLFINGENTSTVVLKDQLKRSIIPIREYTLKPDSIPIIIGKSFRLFSGDPGLYNGLIDEVAIYNRKLSLLEMASIGREEKNTPEAALVRQHYVEHSPETRKIEKRLMDLRKEKVALYDKVEEVMVMEDMPERRTTYLLERGVYNMYGEKVEENAPEWILPFSDTLPKNRMGLALWLVDKRNPLTSRVIINRYWQLIFGKGIVKTAEDFGNQGELPTHPELLDWLASEFMENDWDLRFMLKEMVMSYTYRQSSRPSQLAMNKDPENKYYSHMSTYRWPAELIRDNALAASGLLKNHVGGPSVKPYQPKGMWKDLGDFSYRLSKYHPDSGDSLYRRSMYTFVRRFMPSPFMNNFDSPNREICTPRRVTTNTPLQALNLLNDPQFIEASRVLSERVQKEKELPDQQIELGFRLSTGVLPTEDQMKILMDQYNSAYTHFEENPQLADSLCNIGESSMNKDFNLAKTAALTMVVNTIFNFDETYMKR